MHALIQSKRNATSHHAAHASTEPLLSPVLNKDADPRDP